MAAQKLNVQGGQLENEGLVEGGTVVSVMTMSTWTVMGFDISDELQPTKGIYVASS